MSYAIIFISVSRYGCIWYFSIHTHMPQDIYYLSDIMLDCNWTVFNSEGILLLMVRRLHLHSNIFFNHKLSPYLKILPLQLGSSKYTAVNAFTFIQLMCSRGKHILTSLQNTVSKASEFCQHCANFMYTVSLRSN